MTKVVFYRSNGVFWGFEETGHTGYGDAGDDILCAALSSMTLYIVNTIEVAYDAIADYDINDDDTKIVLSSKSALPEFEDDERKRFAVSGLFMSYYYQLNDLILEYSDFLEVEVINRDYK